MPKTGKKAKRSGLYAPDCGCKEIARSEGERLPPCRKQGDVDWTLTEPTR